jgi:hypothetical protein
VQKTEAGLVSGADGLAVDNGGRVIDPSDDGS